MKCQIPFSGKSKKNTTNLSPTELAKKVVNVKVCNLFSLFCYRSTIGQEKLGLVDFISCQFLQTPLLYLQLQTLTL